MLEIRLRVDVSVELSCFQVPNAEGVEVVVETHVQDISNIDELTSEFHIDLMFSEVSPEAHLPPVPSSLT